MNKPLSEQMQKLVERRERAIGKGIETRARTNADHIRSMTDEELGKYLSAAFHCYGCPARKFCDSVDHLYECHETLADWLQQPYEEVRT